MIPMDKEERQNSDQSGSVRGSKRRRRRNRRRIENNDCFGFKRGEDCRETEEIVDKKRSMKLSFRVSLFLVLATFWSLCLRRNWLDVRLEFKEVSLVLVLFLLLLELHLGSLQGLSVLYSHLPPTCAISSTNYVVLLVYEHLVLPAKAHGLCQRIQTLLLESRQLVSSSFTRLSCEVCFLRSLPWRVIGSDTTESSKFTRSSSFCWGTAPLLVFRWVISMLRASTAQKNGNNTFRSNYTFPFAAAAAT
ncbi:unnamed protein product [Microthlaspi erraticum]|uniref:Uncharacterized protein n=1 Tax=Microthlaspi erraticum TaxID=1685480 RepID=A0A6D2ICW9_9BRAS|nr:unnamed protein product [Microthlaspi erraticum]